MDCSAICWTLRMTSWSIFTSMQDFFVAPSHSVLTSMFASMAGAVIMDIVYGLQVLPKGDPHISAAQKAMDSTTAVITTGSYLVNVLPICE